MYFRLAGNGNKNIFSFGRETKFVGGETLSNWPDRERDHFRENFLAPLDNEDIENKSDKCITRMRLNFYTHTQILHICGMNVR